MDYEEQKAVIEFVKMKTAALGAVSGAISLYLLAQTVAVILKF